MARLRTNGYETTSGTANEEWLFSSLTNQNTTVRSGLRAGRLNSLVSATRKGTACQFSLAASGGKFFIRFYIRYATLPSAANTIFGVSDTNGSTTWVMRAGIKLTSTGTLQLFNETTQVGSDSSALTVNVWHRVEFEFDGTPGAGSDVIKARLDGVEFAASSAQTLTNILMYVVGGNLINEAQTAGDWYFDDQAVNDDTGSFQNSYPGEGEVIVLRPNATGDFTEWSGTFADIDDINPDDATTVISTTDVNAITDVNIETPPAAMDTGDTINCVQVEVRFACEDASTAVAFVLRIKASASGTVEESAVIAATATAWNTNHTAHPRNAKLTLYDLPGASTTPWTKTDLTNAQIGVKMTTADSLSNLDVSALWLTVDHKPTPAAGFIARKPYTINQSIMRGGNY